jgi:acyl-homoserine lactone acylase PvdQ
MRNLGLFETGKTNKLHTDPETLELLQAYADGINSYAKSTKMLPF